MTATRGRGSSGDVVRVADEPVVVHVGLVAHGEVREPGPGNVAVRLEVQDGVGLVYGLGAQPGVHGQKLQNDLQEQEHGQDGHEGGGEGAQEVLHVESG